MASVAEAWLRLAAERIIRERVRLSDLDAAIGDGDHGYNLARGFAAIAGALDSGRWEGASPAGLVAHAGQLILGTVGGASGALYGRALLRAGTALDEATAGRGGPADDGPGRSAGDATATLAAALAAAVEAVAALGRSRSGEKTMLDALLPAAAALEAARAVGLGPAPAAARAALAAEAGAMATVPLTALRGRASYLGERSRGHLDPGAVSSAILLRALADALAGATARPDDRSATP